MIEDCPNKDVKEQEPSYWISVQNGRVPIRVYGKGQRLIIALHGFTYQGKAFKNWDQYLGASFKICAPDLPFHGDAQWNQKLLNDSDILILLKAIAAKEGQKRFILLGHSMGGRFIICTARQLADQLEHTILLGPAGIGSYDRVAPLLFQRIAEWALGLPKWFSWMVRMGHRLGLVSNFHKRYAEVQLFPSASRFQLFRVLNSLSYFATNDQKTIHFWQQAQQPTLIVLGKKDRIIPSKQVEKYFTNTASAQIIEVNEGHELVTENTAIVVRDWLESTTHHTGKAQDSQ